MVFLGARSLHRIASPHPPAPLDGIPLPENLFTIFQPRGSPLMFLSCPPVGMSFSLLILHNSVLISAHFRRFHNVSLGMGKECLSEMDQETGLNFKQLYRWRMYIEIIIILSFNYSQGNAIIHLFKFTPEYGPLYRQYKMSHLSEKNTRRYRWKPADIQRKSFVYLYSGSRAERVSPGNSPVTVRCIEKLKLVHYF